MRVADAGPVLDSIKASRLERRRGRRPFVLRRAGNNSSVPASWAAPEAARPAAAIATALLAPATTAPAPVSETPIEPCDLQRMLLMLEEFSVEHHTVPPYCDRALVTVLFTDIVDSTAHAAALGDRAWREVLDHHGGIARSAVAACGGTLVKETGDGILATFDSPAHGIDCAKTLRDALAQAGLALRAGVHTGEVELRSGDVAGIGVNIAARVLALAASGELLVSRTVSDLVAGAGYAFASRGQHSLKGVPGSWELLAVG